MKKLLLTFLITAGLITGTQVLGAPSQQFSPSILPITDSAYDLGSTLKKWANIYADNLDVSTLTAGTVTISQFVLGDLDSTGCGNFGSTSTSTICGDGSLSSFVGNVSLLGNKLLGGADTTSDLTLQTTTGVGTTGADMHFLVGNNGATEAMTILNNGNVGIGTTTPGKLLDISGSNPSLRVSGTSAINDAAYEFRVGTSEGTKAAIVFDGLNYWGQGDIRFVNDNTADVSNYSVADDTRMIIKNNGNVGIGTTNPGQLLEVYGDNKGIRINDVGVSYSDIWQAGGELIFTNTHATGDMVFQTNSDTKVTIDGATGNVGIGLTAPLAPLHVTVPADNATSTVEIGKTGQNKGSCLVLYDVTGTVVYVTVQGGALVVSATSCK